MATIPSNRVETIASAVSQAFHKISAKDQDRKDANDVFRAAATEAAWTRECLLVEIAAAADQHDMSDSELTMAIDKAKATRNDQKNISINTFANDIKRACHPSVRRHVGEYFTLATEAWDLDNPKGEAKGDGVLRQAFSRKYHMVVGAMFNAGIAGKAPADAQDLADMALNVIRERERDYTKIYQRLQAIKEQLSKFASDFPVDGITCCVEFLGNVTKDELKGCVETPRKVAEDTTAPVVEASEVEPAEGVSDIYQDALDEMTHNAT